MHPHVREAIASWQLEGLVFTVDEIEMLERLARGELKVDDVIRRARATAVNATPQC